MKPYLDAYEVNMKEMEQAADSAKTKHKEKVLLSVSLFFVFYVRWLQRRFVLLSCFITRCI